jgi:nucleotide-binding universal stress UspA family protein
MGTIVLGYDGSEGAEKALATAAALATATGDEVVAAFGYAQFAPGGENRDHELAVAKIAEERLATALGALSAAGVTATTRLIHNNPADALMDLAGEVDARMIVIGSAAQHPLIGALLGSTAYKLVNRSETPVLVVPV